VLDRTAIQSFDPRALNATHQIDSSVVTVLLIQNENGFEKNLSGLNFLPNIYSPYFKLVNAELISDAHAKDIQVIPWTVNEETDIKAMISLGVDGIITDFPKLGLKIVSEMKNY
jgi:glycerophosphoryl diester phosphodiesterase